MRNMTNVQRVLAHLRRKYEKDGASEMLAARRARNFFWFVVESTESLPGPLCGEEAIAKAFLEVSARVQGSE